MLRLSCVAQSTRVHESAPSARMYALGKCAVCPPSRSISSATPRYAAFASALLMWAVLTRPYQPSVRLGRTSRAHACNCLRMARLFAIVALLPLRYSSSQSSTR
ncbi:hypothetical protein DF117_01435 [Burkholderia stagnalis]|nr:hypothetical protein DF117_01435 [Burkholderia stagnalis]